MAAEHLTADYLIVGAGAMGMAFADTILSDTPAKTMIIVDRYDRPGGHWITAYPFVRLHQVAAFYGVNSKSLGRSGAVDLVGWNKGLPELSSRDEICAYYDNLMKQTFLASGRVSYFPKHDYIGEGQFRSILQPDKTYRVGRTTILVDATYSKVEVPSMRPPPYEVASGVDIVTPNLLPGIQRSYNHFTIVGAGKTGIDTCLWILENGIDAAQITWIMPRDSFFLERDGIQPLTNSEKTQAWFEGIRGAFATTTSVEQMWKQMVASGSILQLDENVWPTMWHCATVSRLELEALRSIKSIVRQGRVKHITPGEVFLENGNYIPVPNTLYIDCASKGTPVRPYVPVFQTIDDDDSKDSPKTVITLQFLRMCQQVFSAAFTAHVEATYPDISTKNEICRSTPMPDTPVDYTRVAFQNISNRLRWMQYPLTSAWLQKCRLNMDDAFLPPPPSDPEHVKAYMGQVQQGMRGMCDNIRKLIDTLPAENAHTLSQQIEGYLPSLQSKI